MNQARTRILPRYYELESFRRSVNRKLWVTMTGLLLVALLSLGLALIAFARPIPVVALDGKGRPVLIEDTAGPRNKMTRLRIEHFTREFLSLYIGVDSLSIAEDLQKALSMMTPLFRKVVATDSKEFARRKSYEHQNIRSSLSGWNIRIGSFDEDDLNAKIYLIVTGKMAFGPRIGAIEEPVPIQRWFLTQLILQRVPVTRVSIHGLLADFCSTTLFDTQAELDNHIAEKAVRP